MIKRNRAKERCICYNRNIQAEELEMTSLIKSVPQREIEGKKQGSGERTAQILKKKEKGMNMDHNTLTWGFDSVCRYDGGSSLRLFFVK